MEDNNRLVRSLKRNKIINIAMILAWSGLLLFYFAELIRIQSRHFNTYAWIFGVIGILMIIKNIFTIRRINKQLKELENQ